MSKIIMLSIKVENELFYFDRIGKSVKINLLKLNLNRIFIKTYTKLDFQQNCANNNKNVTIITKN